MKGVLFHLWLIIPSAVLAGGRRRACFCGWAVSLHPGVCPVTLCCRLWFMRCFWREMWDDLRRLRPEAASREEITGHWQVRRDESDALRSCCHLQQDMFTMREDDSPLRYDSSAVHCHLKLQDACVILSYVCFSYKHYIINWFAIKCIHNGILRISDFIFRWFIGISFSKMVNSTLVSKARLSAMTGSTGQKIQTLDSIYEWMSK